MWLRAATVICAMGCASTSSQGDDGGGEPDPRTILDACGLPQPCGMAWVSHTTEDLFSFEEAACIHDVLADPQDVHVTVDSGYGTKFWDLYVAAAGETILVTSHCEERGPCTDYEVEQCTLLDVSAFECSGCNLQEECHGGASEPSARVCGPVTWWCSQLVAAEPACP